MKDYVPGKAGDAEARKDGDRWTLVFVRELAHPPSKVWRALTEPDELREWAPFDADRNLGAIGPATLTLAGATTEEAFESEVREADEPRVLEYAWGEDVVRWELEPTTSGTRLTLHHTLDDPAWLPKVAAGWHMCIDIVDRALSGNPVGRIVGADARDYGWERLNSEYAERFGVENTGWPEEISARRGRRG